MEKTGITSHQLLTITATMSVGGSILVIGSTVAGIAKQDAWMSAIITTIFGVLVMLMYFYLGSTYPNMTLIGLLRKIFGKWLGFAFSVGYVFFFFTIAMHIPYYISSFIGRWMPETPPLAINLFYVAAIVVAMLYGIEAIARASEIFYFTVTVMFIIFVLLLAKEINIEYVTPILARGITPVLKGSYFLSCFVTFAVINVLMIFPRHVAADPKAKTALIKSQLWSGSLSFFTILLTILILGYTVTSKASFPTLLLAEEINIGNFLVRMEYVISVIWLMTEFMIGQFFFFSAVTSLSEVVGLKDHKRIVMPTGLVILIMSGVVLPNSVYTGNYTSLVFPPLITTFGFIIPCAMLVVHAIKKKSLKQQIPRA